MAPNDRYEEILKILHRLRKISVQELVKRFGVTEATIRKDLSSLEEMGYLVRHHGGAMLAEDRTATKSLKARKEEFLLEKQAIAQKAKALIQEGDTVFLDSGSTCRFIAQAISNMNIHVICHSVGVIEALMNAPYVSLICIGGNYRKDAESFIGPLAIDNVKRFQIDVCFIGAAAFSSQGIFYSQNIIEAQLKSELLKHCVRKVVVADHSKYDKPSYCVFGKAQDVDVLITDHRFKDNDGLHEHGITVLLA